jgi:hypothetical protein
MRDEPYLLAALQGWADRTPRQVLFADRDAALAITNGRGAFSTPRFGVILSEFPAEQFDQVDAIAQALTTGGMPDEVALNEEQADPVLMPFSVSPSGLGPLVNFTIVGPNGAPHQNAALIDSGADRAVLPLFYLDVLGIDLKQVRCDWRSYRRR